MKTANEFNEWIVIGTILGLLMIGFIGNRISVYKKKKEKEARRKCITCSEDLEHFDFNDECSRCKYVY
jgi:hypothetical protein